MKALLGKSGWILGLVAILVALVVIARLIQPNYGASGVESLVRASLPFAFATAAMSVAIIVGGVDLSVAAMMAVASVVAARLMAGEKPDKALQSTTASVFEILARTAKRGADELQIETDAGSLSHPMAMVHMRQLMHPSRDRRA